MVQDFKPLIECLAATVAPYLSECLAKEYTKIILEKERSRQSEENEFVSLNKAREIARVSSKAIQIATNLPENDPDCLPCTKSSCSRGAVAPRKSIKVASIYEWKSRNCADRIKHRIFTGEFAK